MPLTPLRSVLNQNSAFQSQIQQLQGFAQSIRQSQARKQQMLEKVASEKEIIQFRSDVELDQKKQFYEDVTEPRLQAERQAEQLQQMQEQFNKSKEDAQKAVKNMQEKVGQSQYSSIYDYNLDSFNYGYDTIEQDGQLMGVKPEVYYGNEKIPASKFTDMVGSLSSFGDELNAAQNANVDLETKQTEDGTLVLGNDDTAKQIIQEVKQDPERAKQYFSMYEQGKLRAAQGEADSGRQTSSKALRDVVPSVMNLRDSLSGNTEMEFGFADPNIEDDWSIGGIFEDTETRKGKVDFSNSIGNVQTQLNTIASQALPQDQQLDIGSLSEKEQTMVITGQLDEEALGTVPEKRAEQIRHLANLGEDTRQEFQRIFQYYNTYETTYQNYVGSTGQQRGKDEYVLDLWGAPQDLSTEKNFKQLLKPINEFESTSKLLDAGASYMRDSQPTNQFVE